MKGDFVEYFVDDFDLRERELYERYIAKSNENSFFKNSLRKKREIMKNSDLVDSIFGFLETMEFIPFDDYCDLMDPIVSKYGFDLKIKTKGEGLLEIAILADVYHPDYNSSPFVVVLNELGGGEERLIYLVKHFGTNLQSFPLDNFGNPIDIPESSFDNVLLRRHLNHLSQKGYRFDRNILKSFSVEVTNKKPRYYLTDITSESFLNGDEIFIGATLGEWQEFRDLKVFADLLRSKKYRLSL
jgi:hypothetical protein